MPIYLSDSGNVFTVTYDSSTTGTLVITPGVTGYPVIDSTTQVSSVATTVIATPNWSVDTTMFSPTGSGVLYYHALSSALTTAGYGVPYVQQTPVVRRPAPKRLAKPAILAGRRALRRSIDLFRKLRPDEEIRRFISGKPLTVRGHFFDYRIQKRDNLLRHTMNPHGHHIPYDFRMLDKTTGQSLAVGCTVIPSTPVIDQLLALLLHLEDPDDEVVILWNTNWSPDVTHRLPTGPATGRHLGERIRMAA